MKTLKKVIALFMVVALFTALFAGCGSSDEESEEEEIEEETATDVVEEEETTEEVEEQVEEEDEESEEEQIETSTTIQQLSEDLAELTIWTSTLMSIELNTSSINELTAIQEYEEKTNVHIDWTQASSSNATEQFNIMIASGDYCDIIIGLSSYYTGGDVGALEEGIIISLTDIVEEYAPNYYSFITEDESVYKEVVTDDGELLSFFSIYDTDYTPTSGMMIRSDWLEELGLDTPITYDDYYEVALAFKTAYDITDPIMMMSTMSFSINNNNACGYLSGGYGVIGFSYNLSGVGAVGLYVEDGVIKSTLIEDGYREYLEMLNYWYEQGVISYDIVSNPDSSMSTDYNAYITSNNTGIFWGDAISMNTYGESSSDEDFALIAGYAPKVNEDDDANGFGIDPNRKQGGGTCITTDCEDVELAMKWLDNWFTDEGTVLANYGVEGLANTIEEDGVRRYTELVLNNPDGLSQQAATVIYSVTFIPTISTQETRFSIWEDNVLEAVAVWNESATGTNVIPGVSLTTDESDTYSSLTQVINTYAAENVIKFVVGEKSFDEYDEYLEELYDMGIEECISVYQAAMDRYNER